MAEPATVTLPNAWAPRAYQRRLWDFLESGGRRAVAVWHRRSGKDSLAINWAAVAAHQRVGTYLHLLPELGHARRTVWDAIDRQGRRVIDQAFPPALRAGTSEQEMQVKLRCGSVWQLGGSDHYDRLVGTNPVGLVFSEYALADPRAWDMLRPILAENGGWALFISTPRGRNHLHRLYQAAGRDDGWFAETLTVHDTGTIPADVLDRERREIGDAGLFAQEYECSFASGDAATFYGALLDAAEDAGRICAVPYEPRLPVETWWDLGLDDSTAIWFVQVGRFDIRVIDFYEANGVGLDHYAGVLKARGHAYDGHVLPHDAEVRELGTGKSRVETLRSLGIRATVCRRQSVEDGINAVRLALPRCWFDRDRCARGVAALMHYQRDFDAARGVYSPRPRHDWTSHAADAFRYGALSLRDARPAAAPPPHALTAYDPLNWRGGAGPAGPAGPHAGPQAAGPHAAGYDPLSWQGG